MIIPLAEVYKLSRDLAKTSYYQTLYSNAKELGFKIFHNDRDLTDLQILFLNYLAFYNNLNIEIATGEVDEIVKTDIIYENSWSFYKNKVRSSNNLDKKKKEFVRDDVETDKFKKTTTKFLFRRK